MSIKGDYEIAITEKLMNNKAFCNRLAKQAEDALLIAFFDELTGE